MAALIQRANQPQGFRNLNNYGTQNALKGAMPDWSTVSVTMTISGRNIQPPNPRATLQQGGTGGAQGGNPGGFPGGPQGGGQPGR
jgi:hypothetical protein